MLQSAFDWAKKGTLDKMNDSSLSSQYETVFATVTLHYSRDQPEKTNDLVWYANGPLYLKYIPAKEILAGNIEARFNQVDYTYLPPKAGQGLSTLIKDLFPDSPQNKLLVSVTQTGFITVGRLINDKLVGNLPPSTFQGTCESELLTGMVDLYGKAICTVSFSLYYSDTKPPSLF
jgi:hypothetical protein